MRTKVRYSNHSKRAYAVKAFSLDKLRHRAYTNI